MSVKLRQDFQGTGFKLSCSVISREGLTVMIDIFLQDKNKLRIVILYLSGFPYFVIQIRSCFTFVIRGGGNLSNSVAIASKRHGGISEPD